MRRKALVHQFLIGLLALLITGPAAYAGDKPEEATATPDPEETAETLQITESMVIDWPEGENWISDYVYTAKSSKMEIFYPAGQTGGDWNEMITVEALYENKKNIAGIARQIYLGTVRGSPNATWDILKKGANEQERPFIIFEIICPDFLSGEPPQVQLWKLIIGETGLFTLQYSYRGKEFPAKRKDQMFEVFDKAFIEVEKK
jgi:hypothetical protein